MTPVFADSFYFLALFNSNDEAHALAVKAAADLAGTLVTTDWILTETADALCGTANRLGCAELINDLRSSTHVEIVPASRALFDAGWDLYQRRPDKDWSLTDCISFIVMQDREITKALTGDRHFVQAGFQVLLA